MFAEEFEADAVERASAVGRVTQLESCEEAALLEAVGDCDALLVRTAARVSREVIDRAPRLRVIGRAGVGLDNIDVEAARGREVVVVYTPSAATDAVADLTIGLMIDAVRNITLGDTMVRAGEFESARHRCIGPELHNLTIGIIGFGRIGRAVARRCRNGFGMTVIYNDIIDVGSTNSEATPVEKHELFNRADVVSLHVPLTDQTRGLIDEAALGRFKPGSILINTSRGAVVDGLAIAGALQAGTLGGAALDVFDPEPLPPDHPLMTAPNTIFTPHVGARSPDALMRMNAVVDDVLDVLRGKPPRFPA